eukprot:gene13356-9561_t
MSGVGNANVVVEGDAENPPVLGAQSEVDEQQKRDAYDGLAQSDHDEPPVPKTFIGRVLALCAEQFKHLANIETVIADTGDFPSFFKWFTFTIYTCAMIGLFVYLFWNNYHDARTNSFITLDPTSGVCKDDRHSKRCCEVPQTITGEFLLDSRSRWSTQDNFNFNRAMYGVTMTGVTYTNAEWSTLMKTIKAQMYQIGAVRGRFRDYSWNLIAWCSFTALSTVAGRIQFYAVGDIRVVFHRPIVTAGYASNVSDTQPCQQRITTRYAASDHLLTAFGYNGEVAASTEFSWAVDMASVSTAIAVNMGIQPLATLVNFPGDNDRISLLEDMYRQGSIDRWTRNHTSSYYEARYAPMDPIYCVDYSNTTTRSKKNKATTPTTTTTDDASVASCLVRIGNTLAYPYINSYGWSSTGYEYPAPCKNTTYGNPAAKFFCNQYDFVVSFVYYPVADVNVSAAVAHATTDRPTRAPTFAPSGPTAPPTVRPSLAPTMDNTRPTQPPTTARPSASKRPSPTPTAAPTATPTASPSAAPTTELPTSTPTVSRRRRVLLGDGDMALDRVDALLTRPHAPTGAQAALYAARRKHPATAPTVAVVSDADADADADWSLYGYYTGTDDFTPAVAPLIDDGRVFTFARIAAAQRRNGTAQTGDVWVPSRGYYAALSALLGFTARESSFARDFDRLCSGRPNSAYAPRGCAVFSVEFYGGANRVVSSYAFQPANQPAFRNTLYDVGVLSYAVKTPPTVLIQSYFSCVKTVWQSLQAASGLAVANTQAYLGLAILAYVYVAILIYNRLLQSFVPYKAQKLMEEQLAEEERQTFLAAILEDVRAGRLTGAFAAEDAIKKSAAEKAARLLAAQQQGASMKNFLSNAIAIAPTAGGD